jgi:NAD(P)-dependent dehydrogenase (short-subunit alcohol dehydrogenase family)
MAIANGVVALAGWFTGGSAPGFVPAVPRRVLDTRLAFGPGRVEFPASVEALILPDWCRPRMFPPMDISGASAIVTGGASGIGAASARLLADRGAKVVIADLQEDKGNELADEIGGAFCKVDVTDTDDIINAVEMAKSMGPVRVLVNSAGIGWAQRTVGKDGTIESAANLDAFKKVIAINLIGSFDCIRIAGTAMSTTEPLDDGERGAIVNIASVAAFDGQIGQASYSASKGGIVGMTLPIARDLSAIGIRVNTVAPGLIDTPIYGEGEGSEAFKENLQKGVLFPKRLGYQTELASMVVECVTNSYMNAETIRVDGGIRMPPK